MILGFLSRYREGGLLLLRVGIGIMFIAHGLPKLMGGPELWTKLGTVATAPLGLHFVPVAFGLFAALAETIGGVLMVFGLFFRLASLSIALTMVFAAVMHLSKGDDFGTWSHPVELAIVLFSLVLIGPGRYSVDKG